MPKQAGVSDRKLADSGHYNWNPTFSAKEEATLADAERIPHNPVGIREQDCEELRKYYDEGEIVELTLVIYIANCANGFSDAVHIAVD